MRIIATGGRRVSGKYFAGLASGQGWIGTKEAGTIYGRADLDTTNEGHRCPTCRRADPGDRVTDEAQVTSLTGAMRHADSNNLDSAMTETSRAGKSWTQTSRDVRALDRATFVGESG
jgi:hypothetical protein